MVVMYGDADDELEALRSSCTRSIQAHGIRSAADLLVTIPVDTGLDVYGAGGVVTELEREVAGLLGKPAAVFLPSGTMAQQAALRVHADRRGRRTVAFHPTCHLDLHEDRAYQRLHHLVGRPVGSETRVLTLEDLQDVAEPLAALLLELPQREIGGRLPEWNDVLAQAAWARDRGAAVHLDGARLWEASAGYGLAPAEVAAPFDSVYVSFYKGIGALAGCCLVGEADVVAEVAEWRHRHGGTLYALWPYAASALTSLRTRLPLMPAYLQRAGEVAAALREIPGVTVVPDPPQTSMMHLLLSAPAEAIAERVRKLAQQQGIWTFRSSMTTIDPAVQKVELSVGDAAMALTVDEVRDAVAALVRD
jgi:threonine aldolase